MKYINEKVVNYLNYNYSNIKQDNIIKQYIFTTDYTLTDVELFLDNYYSASKEDILNKIRQLNEAYCYIFESTLEISVIW